MNEIEKTVWELHDKRLNEHEVRFNQSTRDFTEIKDWLKQLAERLNEGVSKTQQKLLEENKNIELSIKDLTHTIELHRKDIYTKIDTVHTQLVDRIVPLEDSEKKTDRIWWAIVGAFIVMITTFVGIRFLDRIWPKEKAETSAITFPRHK